MAIASVLSMSLVARFHCLFNADTHFPEVLHSLFTPTMIILTRCDFHWDHPLLLIERLCSCRLGLYLSNAASAYPVLHNDLRRDWQSVSLRYEWRTSHRWVLAAIDFPLHLWVGQILPCKP